MKTEANKNAPAYHEAKILIYAPAEKVYNILSTINDWTKWQSNISGVHLHSPLAPGKKFVWKAGGFKIKSEIHTANAPIELGWTGRLLWMRIVHNWVLVPDGKSTLVIVKESMEGFLVVLMQNILKNTLSQNLIELKIQSEKERD